MPPKKTTSKPRERDVFSEARRVRNRIVAIDLERQRLLAQAGPLVRKMIEALDEAGAHIEGQASDDDAGPVSE